MVNRGENLDTKVETHIHHQKPTYGDFCPISIYTSDEKLGTKIEARKPKGIKVFFQKKDSQSKKK